NLTITDGGTPPPPPSCGNEGGVEVCCNIAADPDGDGMGMENGEACIVTEDTAGWHPPNPSDVLAAINVGGQGDAVQIGETYYAPNLYAIDGMANATTDSVTGGNSSVYQTELYGDFSFCIPISNQRVTVELGFV